MAKSNKVDSRVNWHQILLFTITTKYFKVHRDGKLGVKPSKREEIETAIFLGSILPSIVGLKFSEAKKCSVHCTAR